MKNSEIIKELVEKYLAIENDSVGQEIVLDKKFYDTKKQCFNESTLTEIDNKEINFILIGDNPGNTEKAKQRYFNESGSAGRFARTFLEVASFYHSYGEEPFTYLIFNKTLFHSGTTDKLKIDNAVEKSCRFIIEALSKFSKANPSLIILIVGRYKKNDLNKSFYKLLEAYVNQDFGLSQKIRFADHFSNGNFHDQWIRNDWIGIKHIKGSSLLSTLTRIHEETYPKINKDFKLEFMKKDIIHKMNEKLDQMAKDQQNNVTLLNYSHLDNLISLSEKYSGITLLFHEEIERSLDQFIDFDKSKLKRFHKLQRDEVELKKEKATHVKNKEFEKAARTRDELRKVEDEKFEEIIRLNNFNQGFNSYKGCVLIVQSKDSLRANIIDRFIKEKRKTNSNT